MDSLALWKYVHILILVFWLGTDVGVLLLAKRARDAKLDLGQRGLLMQMAGLIDLSPRIAFALMFPAGLQLAAASGLSTITTPVIVLAWLVALAWLWVIAQIVRNEGKPIAATLQRLQLFWLILLCAGTVALGVWSMLQGSPFAPIWLGLKVLLFGVICAVAIGLDWAFKPVGPAFVQLATEGSSPEVEAAISGGIDNAVRYVYLLYMCLLVMAFLGVAKPI